MDVAADVLREIDAHLIAPAAVRRGSVAPWSLLVEPGELLDVLPRLMKAELAAVGVGRLAIIAPQSRIGELDLFLRTGDGSTGEGSTGDVSTGDSIRFADDPDALDAATVVLTPGQSKGLEFDAVLVVQPQEILDESGSGVRDLYVALTRATQRVGIVHTGELPRMLARATPS
jgi:hypothetical protein